MTVVAFVPAKSTSERLKNKNKFILGGDPLFVRKLKQLLECKLVDEVWLDTDSEEFASMVSNLPVKIHLRSPNLATNATDGHELFCNEVSVVKEYASVVIQSLCTAPFLGPNSMDTAIKQLLSSKASSLVAVQEQTLYTWTGDDPDYGYGRVPNSVDLPRTISETMSFYAVKSEIFADKRRFGRAPIFYNLNPIEAIDINTQGDLDLAISIQRGEDLQVRNYFDILKFKLSSAILGDTCKELQLKNVYLPKDLNLICGKTIMGFARPLKLRSLTQAERRDNHSWKGIYSGLQHYDYVSSADILVVSNQTECAYFGDLNCRVAMSKGVNGIIVEGATRDVRVVEELGFSVAAQRVWSNDVKFEATVDTINREVTVGDATIHPGDLIFSDYQGTLCIPRENYKNVIKHALQGIQLEGKLESEIVNGNDIIAAIDKYGVF